MRDFRDAKIIARTLRDALQAKPIEITYSEPLELIANAFGRPKPSSNATRTSCASRRPCSPSAASKEADTVPGQPLPG